MDILGVLFSLRRKLMTFPWNRWAKSYLLSHGVEFSDIDSVKFLGNCFIRVSRDSYVHIGRDFVCRSGPEYSFDNYSGSKIVVNSGSKLYVGEGTGISNTLIYCNDSIRIGSNVKIGGGCWIMDSNFHSLDFLDRRVYEKDWKNIKTAPVVIGDDAFIGARTTICKGVTIGNRSVIQAGSVVTRSIPDDCIAGGNPCQVFKKINHSYDLMEHFNL